MYHKRIEYKHCWDTCRLFDWKVRKLKKYIDSIVFYEILYKAIKTEDILSITFQNLH